MGGYTLQEDASLASHNTLRVAARARWLVELNDAAKLPGVLGFPALQRGPLRVLGEGSNVLFTADYPGTVLVMRTRGVQVEQDADRTRIAVAAGERWDDFVRWSLGQGYAGLENLILIPGTVGAAPIQNIGAYGVEVARYIESVEAWDRHTARVVRLDRTACGFAYRDSLFKRHPDRYIVTAVRFALPREAALTLDYAGIRDELDAMGIQQPAPFHVAEAVVRLRTRKLPDPNRIGNAGSFFKNPLADAATAAQLARAHPSMPQWPGPEGVKLSAAWLIEACGFKGLREGNAGISNRHALVLVNHGNASGAELWALAQRVQAGVAERFGVKLEPEPVVIGAG
ncbi:MAG TPA: UDP-N-acetylmuramate dehydrogenase [Rhodanobacteraceae bacterium]|nr:UDP-N-acetylmuramate dehydrogenase [Rhodanobacteraceae bacterium]